jgi:hypothetical protein
MLALSQTSTCGGEAGLWIYWNIERESYDRVAVYYER